MALYYQDGQRAKIKKVVEVKDNYSIIHMTTSRKKTDYEVEHASTQNPEHNFLLGKYAYSDWGFVRFVGKAHTALKNLKVGDVIVIKGYETHEQYENKEGDVVTAKNPQRVVFECTLFSSNGNNGEAKKNQKAVELPPEDDLPF